MQIKYSVLKIKIVVAIRSYLKALGKLLCDKAKKLE